ncbi:hypothetical protein BO94DRAFT_539213 [Aspergillus sclerotioniger CBS 115572]|uniref:Uncharacterized protein n=1 Tax=Aspergillus sclerotioniger CBS 115572 TaxID=1450535 RepID=A0A317VDS9_9EURO|nr:hypothetical protein BO94DRAFT_539213 [Aspergillus sclerotioniger CBS 115572]PWY72534.1 hypothetical protein BO94DRAFT_539213 [Aspergillus sclerotioniger CBS 115572]
MRVIIRETNSEASEYIADYIISMFLLNSPPYSRFIILAHIPMPLVDMGYVASATCIQLLTMLSLPARSHQVVQTNGRSALCVGAPNR